MAHPIYGESDFQKWLISNSDEMADKLRISNSDEIQIQSPGKCETLLKPLENGYLEISANVYYEDQDRILKFNMADPTWLPPTRVSYYSYALQNLSKPLENAYFKVFRVVDYETEDSFSKFKMTNSICQPP